jgi:uncharacterized SAM-binding protein YcdF (DUF218 family)
VSGGAGCTGSQDVRKSQEAVIWLLCHYPDTLEAEERIDRAVALHRESGAPIWLYGSNSARYPESVERLLKAKLVRRGVPVEAVTCSGERPGARPSLDTVQEACNVAAEARARGVRTLVCVSNRLQLAQVRGLLRREPLSFVWVATPLRDRRWWYVAGRLALIPLAYLGVGPRFVPLIFVRWARARLAAWPF